MVCEKLGINLNVEMIPEHMVDGVMDYLEFGLEPGGFLRAVLENDLVHAFGCADRTNIHRMEDWASFIYNEMPMAAWGSKKKVDAWIEARREDRRKELNHGYPAGGYVPHDERAEGGGAGRPEPRDDL